MAGNVVYESESFIILEDIKPDAKIHLLGIPKKHFDNFFSATENDFKIVKEIMIYVKEHTEALGLSGGYRMVVNTGKHAVQTVSHFHIHFLGGQQLLRTHNHLVLLK